MLRRWTWAAGLVCGAVLVGCTTSVPEASPVPTLASTPTPTPTPDPTPEGIVETSDPELGVIFEDVPDLTGDEAEVYNWVAVYEKEYWRTLTTGAVSPAFDLISSVELREKLDSLVRSNDENQLAFGGVLHVRISSIDVDGDTATASVCRDFADTTPSKEGRAMTPEDAGASEPLLKDVTLLRIDAEDRWIVQDNPSVGSC